jgi:hypothetical protein
MFVEVRVAGEVEVHKLSVFLDTDFGPVFSGLNTGRACAFWGHTCLVGEQGGFKKSTFYFCQSILAETGAIP